VTPYYSKDGIEIFCGDCREILPSLSGIDVVITDPPYEITATGGGIGATRKYLHDTTGFTDCGFDYSLLGSFDNWACFGTLRQVPKLIEVASDRRWMLVTWNKPNPCPLVNGNYLPDTEYIVHAWRKGNLFGQMKDRSRYIVHPLGDKEHGRHPNEKPVRVMCKIASLASDDRWLICDPFMGSGTTLVAAKRLGRRAIGIDISEEWCEVAVNRLRQGVLDLTG